MSLHAANIGNSDRLRRVLAALEQHGELSTLQIANLAQVCAVNSCVAELRANGHTITCGQRNRVFYYKLAKPQEAAA